MAPKRKEVLSEHLGLWLAIGGTALVALRLLAISGYQSETAYAILSTQGTGQALTGAIVDMIPILGVGGVSVATWLFNQRNRHARRPALALGVLGAALAPWPFAIALALSILGTFALVALSDRVLYQELGDSAEDARGGRRTFSLSANRKKRKAERLTKVLNSSVTMFALTAFLSGFVLADRPWLPSEAITVNGETVTGYVLSEDSGQLVILRDDSRVAIWLEEPVGSREFCAVQIPSLIRYTIAAPPLLSLGMRHGDYPECP